MYIKDGDHLLGLEGRLCEETVIASVVQGKKKETIVEAPP